MFARTKRLTLRPGWPEDAKALTQAVAHQAVATMLSRLPWPYTKQHAADWLRVDHQAPDLSLLIFTHEQASPALVGGIGLHRGRGNQELGYWVTPSAWGRGYATEAGRAVVAMARHTLGLKHLVSGHFTDNAASGRVLRKLGFREVGGERRHCEARGHAVPCALFELDLEEEDRPALSHELQAA